MCLLPWDFDRSHTCYSLSLQHRELVFPLEHNLSQEHSKAGTALISVDRERHEERERERGKYLKKYPRIIDSLSITAAINEARASPIDFIAHASDVNTYRTSQTGKEEIPSQAFYCFFKTKINFPT